MRKPFRERLREGVILFDGGMGTELYKRGVFINVCYDALNIANPALVLQVCQDYVRAGAEVIETNTYGANRFKLAPHGFAENLRAINVEGARIAREAAGEERYVAGSVGPLGVQIEPLGPMSLDEARDAFLEQIRPLVEAGVDCVILETFTYFAELQQAVNACRALGDFPVIAQMTINDDGSSLTGAEPEVMIAELDSLGADVIGVNCTVGPHVMLGFLERTRPLTDRPMSIMPNAGKPRNIDGRNIYMTSPEYMAEYAKRFIQMGATVIGGCCGTAPDHIRAMRSAIAALSPAPIQREVVIRQFEKPPEVETVLRPRKSRLARRLSDGRFVTFVELTAPRGVSAEKELENARKMFFYGIDVINIPDGPRASARMSALSLAIQIQQEVGIETVLHFACRDRNVIGMQSDLLGAYAMGIRNILAITGDPPKLGNYPDATAVFDVDAIGLVNILNRLNHGLDIAGNPIGTPSGFHIGVGVNPGAINMEEELRRLDWKVEAGAEFIVTQPVFDVRILERFLERIAHIRLPLIAGLWPLVSLRNAEFMNNEVPGCVVPEGVMERFRKCGSKEEARAEGIAIARETLAAMRDRIQGVQISAPFGRVDAVVEILES